MIILHPFIQYVNIFIALLIKLCYYKIIALNHLRYANTKYSRSKQARNNPAMLSPEVAIPEETRKQVGKVAKGSTPEKVEEPKVLTIDSPQIRSFKLSVISKPNEIKAFIPELFAPDAELIAAGLEKEDDGWHVPNRDWFPKAISESDIVIMYGPNDLGFCSQEEFGMIYAKSDDYKEGRINYIDPKNLKSGEVIDATKCATGEFVVVPAGTMVMTNEGPVQVKSGEAVAVNERKNSIYATNIKDTVLKRYIADPMNPASRRAYMLLEGFCAAAEHMSVAEVEEAHEQMAEDFTQIQRSSKLNNIFNTSETTGPPETLQDEYNLASKISDTLDSEVFARIDAMDFDTRLKQAEVVLREIVDNENLTQDQKNVMVSAVQVRLLPKTNNHQHLKGSVPESVLLEIARSHDFDLGQIAKIKDAYAAGRIGFDDLNAFNSAYGAIGSAIRTPTDYRMAVKGIIEEAVRQGQLTVEIRCAALGQRDEEGKPLSPDDAIMNIVRAIQETCVDIKKRGGEPPYTGFTILAYRGKDWKPEEVTEHAQLAVKYAKLYPEMKFGFDLAGPEDVGYKPSYFKEAYDHIKEYNKAPVGETVGVTIHAGETPECDGMPGYMAVEQSLDMGANRIGHGVQAINHPDTMQKLKESGATVEICGVCNITSIPKNTRGLAIHPIQEFIENDIPIAICTDNDAICSTNVSREYMQFLLTGHDSFMNWNAVKAAARNGIVRFYSRAPKVSGANAL